MSYLFLSGDNVATLNKALVPHFMGLQQEALVRMSDVLGRAVRDDVQIDLDNLYDFRADILGPGGADLVGITDTGGYYTGTTVEDALQELGADLNTAWGEISGTLSNQTDLQNALDSKVDDSQISVFGATLIDDANAATARTTLGLGTAATAAATSFQPSDATLTALAGLTTAADQGIVATGVDTFSMYTLSAFARTILDDTTAAGVRTTIGAGTVTSVGAIGSTGLTISGSPVTTSGSITYTLSANLQSWSGITPATKADDSGVVHLAGTESITGVKTFTQIVTSSQYFQSNGVLAGFRHQDRTTGADNWTLYADAGEWRVYSPNNEDVIKVNKTTRTLSDFYGPVRNVPITDQNATYTFVATDRGRARRKTNTTAYTYTVDAVHSAGDILTAINNNGTANLTIAQGAGVTLRLGGTATTGNRTVGPHGYATIYMQSATEGYVSGPGVT